MSRRKGTPNTASARATASQQGETYSIPYTPHKSQLELHESSERFRVAVCGRRFGKTTFALAELVFNAMLNNPKSINWYIAPTYRQAKQIAWKMLQELIPPQLITRKHEMELSLTLWNGSVIELKGTDNPDSLRGVGLDLVVLDEYASMKPFVWEEIVRPSLADRGGRAIFIGTPKGYNHFYDLFLMGQAGSKTYDSDYISWRKTTYDNPYIEVKEIEAAKRTMTESSFQQEFMADFRSNTGKVYKDFDRMVNVIPSFDTPSYWTYGRFMDRGWRVPTGVGFVAIDDNDNWYIVDEIYETDLTNPVLAEMVKSKSGGRYFWHSYADSAQASDIEDLMRLGCTFTPVIKNTGERAGEAIKHGIEMISERLRIQPGTGKPKLFIFSSCKNIIKEFEGYEWDDKRSDEVDAPVEKPKKKNDHLMDGLRYFAMMYKREIREPESVITNNKDWTFN